MSISEREMKNSDIRKLNSLKLKWIQEIDQNNNYMGCQIDSIRSPSDWLRFRRHLIGWECNTAGINLRTLLRGRNEPLQSSTWAFIWIHLHFFSWNSTGLTDIFSTVNWVWHQWQLFRYYHGSTDPLHASYWTIRHVERKIL